MLILFLCMSMVAVLLVMEYRFFADKTRQILALRQTYEDYITCYKNLIHEYHVLKDQKKEPTDQRIGQEMLPATSWYVNRDYTYLTSSALLYAKDYNLEHALKKLYEFSDGADYSIEHLLTKQNQRRIVSKDLVSKLPVISHVPVKSSFLKWPIDRALFWISSKFGPRGSKFHYGIDMAAFTGTPVKASADGIVAEVSDSKKGYGKTIVIAHKNNLRTRYAHLSAIVVRYIGQRVCEGEIIGHVGNTGLVKGKYDASHLHFEVKELGKHINPLLVLT